MTEMITGVDLIQEQIKAAQGDVLRFKQEDIKIKVRELRCLRAYCSASACLLLLSPAEACSNHHPRRSGQVLPRSRRAGACDRVPHQRGGPIQELPAGAGARDWVPAARRPQRAHGQPPVPRLPGAPAAGPPSCAAFVDIWVQGGVTCDFAG